MADELKAIITNAIRLCKAEGMTDFSWLMDEKSGGDRRREFGRRLKELFPDEEGGWVVNVWVKEEDRRVYLALGREGQFFDNTYIKYYHTGDGYNPSRSGWYAETEEPVTNQELLTLLGEIAESLEGKWRTAE